MNTKIKQITRLSIVCAMYIVLTILNPFSYDTVQFRISEILIFLCFFRKDYAISLILGCFISNLFSPLMIYDIIFGTLATALACICIMFSKKLIIGAIYPIVFNGILVSLELSIAFQTTFWFNAFWVVLGESIVIIIGLLIFIRLKNNKMFLELIDANQNNN